MRRKRAPRAEESFQMAPMIDMVFLLLVFFMTVSTLAKDARPELDLALSTTAAVPEEAPPREVVTVLTGPSGFRYYWHNKEVSESELTKLLDQFSKASLPGELLLRGHPELPWEAWEVVFGLCRTAGVQDMIFSTFES